MLTNLSLGIYYPGNSLLHRLQARTKLLLNLWLIGCLIVADRREWHFAPFAVITALACAGLVLSGVSLRHLWHRLRFLLLITLAGGTVLLLFPEGQPVVTLGPIVLTHTSIWLWVSLVVLLVVPYVLAMLLTMTSTPVGLIEGVTLALAPLRLLRLPVDDFALMTLLALRFIPILIDEVEGLIKAQTARGADFTQGTILERGRNLAALFIPLMQGSFRRAAELAMALESRGYQAEGRQTSLHERSLRMLDYVALIGVVALTGVTLLL